MRATGILLPTPSMTRFKRGDVVLVRFPFTDASSSKRLPAIVISSRDYNMTSPDVLIASVTSRLDAIPHLGDHVISDWRKAGLLVPSLAQTKIATIESKMIERTLGQLDAEDWDRFEVGLRRALGFT